MPKSVNHVVLLGNLGKDPEVRYTNSGTAVATVSLATSEGFKDKNGDWQDRTEWHNLVLWQRLAEIAGEYLHKGSKVYVAGRLQTRSWEDRETSKKMYKTEIVVQDLVMLDGRGSNGGREEDEPYAQRGAQQQGRSRVAQESTAVTESSPITDEDIPF